MFRSAEKRVVRCFQKTRRLDSAPLTDQVLVMLPPAAAV